MAIHPSFGSGDGPLLSFRLEAYGIRGVRALLFVLFFFRDPERTISEGKGYRCFSCDGKVIVIKDIYEPDYLKQDVKQISIFLSVFNVHVNRTPIGGRRDGQITIPASSVAWWTRLRWTMSRQAW